MRDGALDDAFPALAARSLLAMRDITKIHRAPGGDVAALRGISVTVESGGYVAVMGESGSGKSTFLSIAGCLDRATSGSYWLEGQAVSDLSADGLAELRKRRLGYVFQSFNLLPRMTVIDNVALPMAYAGLAPARRRARALERLAQVGIADYALRLPRQLSGGQQQRVAIARALVNDPAVIFADEPTGALDPANTAQVLDLFDGLNETGITIMLVTHDRTVGSRARRLLRFDQGTIASDVRQGRSR
jgi:putative ABC transport system ATP-binding protein